MPDPARARRLREARSIAGWNRPVDAVTAFGWNRSTYFAHENGSRGISRDRIMVYAAAFRVAADWLAYGQGRMRPGRRRIRIEGHIGSLGMSEQTGLEQDEIELPPGIEGDDFMALRVHGDDGFPVLQDGDVVLVPRQHGPPEDYIGRRCVVWLGGRHLVRTLMRGSRPGLFILVNYASPPTIDVEIQEAVPIAWVKYAG